MDNTSYKGIVITAITAFLGTVAGLYVYNGVVDKSTAPPPTIVPGVSMPINTDKQSTTITLTGTVMELRGGKPLPNCNIQVFDAKDGDLAVIKETTSDKDGKYKLVLDRTTLPDDVIVRFYQDKSRSSYSFVWFNKGIDSRTADIIILRPLTSSMVDNMIVVTPSGASKAYDLYLQDTDAGVDEFLGTINQGMGVSDVIDANNKNYVLSALPNPCPVGTEVTASAFSTASMTTPGLIQVWMPNLP